MATPEEEAEEAATEAYQKSLEFIFEVVLLSAVGVLGIVGNAALIALFAWQKVRVSEKNGKVFY